MDGIHLPRKIGIIGGGITGLIVGIFLAKEGFKVTIYEKNKLLAQTSSKTTKLLHGGLRYLENLHFNEVKNGLNDRFWWLENFPKHTSKLKISIPFKSIYSIAFLKSFLGIKLYEILAGSKNIGSSNILKLPKDDVSILKNEYNTILSFFDGSMDDISLGSELIQSARDLNIDLLENTELEIRRLLNFLALTRKISVADLGQATSIATLKSKEPKVGFTEAEKKTFI